MLAGLVSIPGFWSNKEEFFLHEWIKMPKKWIDPLKEANATKVALNSGIKSYKQVAAENGMDWREQIDDMAEVLEYASERGIGLGGVLFDGKLKEEKEGPGGQGNNGGDADASSGDGKDGSTDTGQG